MTTLVKVPADQFLDALDDAQQTSELVAENTTLALDMPEHKVTYWLTLDGKSGYGVTYSGELVGVFSLVAGRGNALVAHAVRHGAYQLDCFDGYLPTLYGRHGFTETKREANWDGEEFPDVVFMQRLGN